MEWSASLYIYMYSLIIKIFVIFVKLSDVCFLIFHVGSFSSSRNFRKTIILKEKLKKIYTAVPVLDIRYFSYIFFSLLETLMHGGRE